MGIELGLGHVRLVGYSSACAFYSYETHSALGGRGGVVEPRTPELKGQGLSQAIWNHPLKKDKLLSQSLNLEKYINIIYYFKILFFIQK